MAPDTSAITCETVALRVTSCDDIQVNGDSQGDQRVWILATGAPSLSGVALGIRWDATVAITGLEKCVDGLEILRESESVPEIVLSMAFPCETPESEITVLGSYRVAAGSKGNVELFFPPDNYVLGDCDFVGYHVDACRMGNVAVDPDEIVSLQVPLPQTVLGYNPCGECQ